MRIWVRGFRARSRLRISLRGPLPAQRARAPRGRRVGPRPGSGARARRLLPQGAGRVDAPPERHCACWPASGSARTGPASRAAAGPATVRYRAPRGRGRHRVPAGNAGGADALPPRAGRGQGDRAGSRRGRHAGRRPVPGRPARGVRGLLRSHLGPVQEPHPPRGGEPRVPVRPGQPRRRAAVTSATSARRRATRRRATTRTRSASWQVIVLNTRRHLVDEDTRRAAGRLLAGLLRRRQRAGAVAASHPGGAPGGPTAWWPTGTTRATAREPRSTIPRRGALYDALYDHGAELVLDGALPPLRALHADGRRRGGRPGGRGPLSSWSGPAATGCSPHRPSLRAGSELYDNTHFGVLELSLAGRLLRLALRGRARVDDRLRLGRLPRRARRLALRARREPELLGSLLHRGDHEGHVLVEVHAQLLRARAHLVAVDAGGEARLLELLLDRLRASGRGSRSGARARTPRRSPDSSSTA